MEDIRLSRNFTLSEFIFSQTAVRCGISNTPTKHHKEKLVVLCEGFLQPLRDKIGKSVRVTSGYRSKALNKEIRGSDGSQHSKGEAVDFVVHGWTSTQLCQYIIDQGMEFDQLIDEGGWVHASYKKENNRNEVLTANFEKDQDGKTKVSYSYGLKEV